VSECDSSASSPFPILPACRSSTKLPLMEVPQWSADPARSQLPRSPVGGDDVTPKDTGGTVGFWREIVTRETLGRPLGAAVSFAIELGRRQIPEFSPDDFATKEHGL
jgi:hypothetical protein